MSYLALYRKFRPTTFDDVRGQDHIVTTLKNQLKNNRLGHAYLFCGTRGTGKTTIARIMAKAVNCENPKDGCPCGECAMCRSIDAQNSLNVIEIDAASNNGVDNIREIVDEVKYSPTEGKYKVYIIDEVHMLSAGAFNALLKTLEEPPAYVMFILATTEVHKLPITILSRCQRYDFRRISVETLTKRLIEIVAEEGIKAEEKALQYVARVADGSFRDSLSLLDQCIAFLYGQELTYEKVLDVLGTVDIEVFAKLLRYIRKQDVTSVMNLVTEVVEGGRELTQFVVDFVWYLRNLLFVKTADDPGSVLDMSADQMNILANESAAIDETTLLRYIRIMSDLSGQIKYSAQKRVLLEVSLIKLCCPSMETDEESLKERIRVLEERLEQALEGGAFAVEKKEEAPKKRLTEEEKKELVLAMNEDIRQIAQNWGAILSKLQACNRVSLSSCTPIAGNGNHLIIMTQSEWDKKDLENRGVVAELKSAAAEVTGKEIEVDIVFKGAEEQKAQAVLDISKLCAIPVEMG